MANLWLPGNAGPADVRSGKKFGAGGNYDAEGTLADNGAGGTITPGTADQTVAAGIWDTDVTVDGDLNLVSGNIKADVTLFGVPGDSNVVDTSTSTAPTAGDLLMGTEAFANGAAVSGTMTNKGSVTLQPGESSGSGYVEDVTAASPSTGSEIWSTPGTYDFPAPSGSTRLLVYAVGAGAGGGPGGESYNSPDYTGGGGGGGGAGAMVLGWLPVIGGQVVTIEVPAGGSSGSAGGAATVTFGSNAINAPGGSPGGAGGASQNGSKGANGAAGPNAAPSSAYILGSGSTGQAATAGSNGSGGTGAYCNVSIGNISESGSAGAGGAAGVANEPGSAGSTATGIGAGGGGGGGGGPESGFTVQPGGIGGDGAPGYVQIQW